MQCSVGHDGPVKGKWQRRSSHGCISTLVQTRSIYMPVREQSARKQYEITL